MATSWYANEFSSCQVEGIVDEFFESYEEQISKIVEKYSKKEESKISVNDANCDVKQLLELNLRLGEELRHQSEKSSKQIEAERKWVLKFSFVPLH